MKKLLLFFITLIFLAVSCSGSKKSENDADVLLDKDVNDTDEESGDSDEYDNDTDILPDEDATDADENDEDNDDEPDESSDTDEDNPCNPNPCEGLEHATGECIVDEWNGMWNHSITCVCDVNYYWWNGRKCTNECEGNPCQYEEHAIADSCSLFDTSTGYKCDCEEGYHWAYFDCEKDPEED